MRINKELREIIRNSKLYKDFVEWAEEGPNSIKYAEEKLNDLVRTIQTYLGED